MDTYSASVYSDIVGKFCCFRLLNFVNTSLELPACTDTHNIMNCSLGDSSLVGIGASRVLCTGVLIVSLTPYFVLYL